MPPPRTRIDRFLHRVSKRLAPCCLRPVVNKDEESETNSETVHKTATSRKTSGPYKDTATLLKAEIASDKHEQLTKAEEAQKVSDDDTITPPEHKQQDTEKKVHELVAEFVKEIILYAQVRVYIMDIVFHNAKVMLDRQRQELSTC